jgi:predicted Zn-dependent protease with MMP-like domain
MLEVSDSEFEEMINAALDALPKDRIEGLKNIAITYADEPSSDQRKRLHLRGSQTLYGLYEGIPLTKRAATSTLLSSNFMVLPDKITIFKRPIVQSSQTLEEVKEQVRHTLWHEIAHYYGLNHKQIHDREV